MIAYKVIRKHDGLFTSAFTSGNLEVVYRIGEWVRPKKETGGLLVFERQFQAEDFVRAHYSLRLVIFRCRIPAVIRRITRLCYSDEYLSIIRFWRMKRAKINQIIREMVAPEGTLLAKKVKLLREIDSAM